MNFSDEDIGLTPVQYTSPQQAAPSSAPAKGGLSDSDIGLSDADIGLNEPQGHFGEWGKAFTDIPSEIGKQYSGAWQGVKEGLGPSGKGTEGVLASTLKTGQGLLNAAYLGSGVGPAVVGTARSLIGHPMAEAEHAIGSTIAPDIAAQDNPEEMYQTAAGNAETALGAMGRVPGAPAPSLVPSPVRRAITPFPTAPERLAARDVWRNATGEDPTAGAVTGRPVIQRTESTLGDAPMAFSAYSKAMRRNNEGFSRFVANSFGETNSLVDSDALQSARDRLGARFESASQGMEIAHDKRLGGDLAKIASDLGNEGLSDPEVKRVTQMLTNVQNGFVTKNKGPALMEGEAYQTLTRKDTPLDRATSDPNPNISYYATRVRSALDDAMERTVDTAVKNAFSKGKQGGPAQARAMQLAQAQEDLKDARRQWFNMKAAEGAADEEGIVTPQRLRRALTNTQDRKTMYALSRGDLAPVARAGVTLFRGLPDSGTAQRSLITTLAAALPGAFLWGEPVSGMAATAAAPGLVGRAMLSRPIQAYLKNQLLSDRAAVPPAPSPTPGTSLITSPGRAIAPWQQPSITPNATAQIRRRFPWLATGEIPHFGDEQQRKHGGRALRTAYRARRRADGGDASDDDLVIPPASAAGTVGPSAANAVGRAVGSAAAAPLWDAGQYVGGLLHGNEQWDPSKAVQLAGGLGAMFFPFGRGSAAAKGAADMIESAAPRVASDAAKGIDVYHGSPHDFDRFDLSKIGTGEGAQAYGHGLYFADNPDVAKAYAEALPRVGNEPFDGSNPLHAASMAIHESGSREGAIKQITDTMNRPGFYGDKEFHDFDNATLKILRDPTIQPPPMRIGRQYAARINADPEHFLDWDAPLTAQHPKVQAAISKFQARPDPQTGEGLYSWLTNQVRGTSAQGDAAASQALRAAGIPGVRYADQGSRGLPLADSIDSLFQRNHPELFAAEKNSPRKSREWIDAYDEAAGQVENDMAKKGALPKQTSNYVVFDDKLIDILKKYGMAGLASVPGGAGLLAGMKQQRARGGRVNPANIDHAPTEAQKKAGNYSKDHLSVHGLDIAIENAKGKMRRGVDKDGKPWAVRLPAHYGYIKRSEGADGDHVDCYLGPHLKSPNVFVVDQLNADTGKFDEHKCFLGFGSKAQVRRAYHAAFSDGKSHERLGNISEMPIDKFKGWLARGDTTKPLAA